MMNFRFSPGIPEESSLSSVWFFFTSREWNVWFNYSRVIDSIDEILGHWSEQRLTVLGRISIIKTLALPKLYHILLTIPNPPCHILENIQKLFLYMEWVWPDTAYKQHSLPYKFGGLRMIDSHSFIHSLN